MNREYFKEKLEVASTDNILSDMDAYIDKSIGADSDTIDILTRLKVITTQEMAEFTCEVTDEIRGKGDLTGILEEMADVIIVLRTMQKVYRISDESVLKALRVKVDTIDELLNIRGKVI